MLVRSDPRSMGDVLHELAARKMADRPVQRRQRSFPLNRQPQQACIRHLAVAMTARSREARSCLQKASSHGPKSVTLETAPNPPAPPRLQSISTFLPVKAALVSDSYEPCFSHQAKREGLFPLPARNHSIAGTMRIVSPASEAPAARSRPADTASKFFGLEPLHFFRRHPATARYIEHRDSIHQLESRLYAGAALN